jgi:hypothetical protein
MSEWSSEETQQTLADLAEPPPLTNPAAVGRLINAQDAELPRLGANLGLASTREMLEELEARGIVLGGHDGRALAQQAAAWLRSVSSSLSACMLEYRTVDLVAPAVATAGRWQEMRIMAESGFFTSEGCVLGACRHTRPQDALTCRAREAQDNA